VELWDLRFLSVRPGQPSCGLLSLIFHTRLKCLSGARYPSAGLLGSNSCVTAALFCMRGCVQTNALIKDAMQYNHKELQSHIVVFTLYMLCMRYSNKNATKICRYVVCGAFFPLNNQLLVYNQMTIFLWNKIFFNQFSQSIPR